MKFLYITYHKKRHLRKELISESLLKRVHSAPIEHAIVYWLQKNLETVDSVISYDLPNEMVESFYNTLLDAHAEKSRESPRPW